MTAEKILAIGAHPDDVEISAGGWLLHMKDTGSEISVVTLTSGQTTGNPEERIEEQKQASKFAGFTHYQLLYEDGHLKQEPDTIDDITRIIRMIEPDIVISHSVHDHHQDHVELSRAVQSSLRYTDITHIEFSSWNPRVQSPWNYEFVLSPSMMKRKEKLLSLFASQQDKPFMLVHAYERFHIKYMMDTA